MQRMCLMIACTICRRKKLLWKSTILPFGTLSARCLAHWCNCSGDQKFWSRTFGDLRPAGKRNCPTEQGSIQATPTMGIKLVDSRIYGTQLSEDFLRESMPDCKTCSCKRRSWKGNIALFDKGLHTKNWESGKIHQNTSSADKHVSEGKRARVFWSNHQFKFIWHASKGCSMGSSYAFDRCWSFF